MSSDIEFRDIVTFESPSAFKSKKWGDSAIWGVISKYPKAFQEKFRILQDATHEYLKNGFSTDFFIKYRFTRRFMKSFTYNLAETESLEKSFLGAKGIKEEIGLTWSCNKIQNYYRQNLRPPSCREHLFDSIYYYCKSCAFKKFGIKTWPELLHEALKGYQHIELERTSIQGAAGFQRACTHILKISHQRGRIPQINDPGLNLIKHASNRGSWTQFGINNWTDLLRHVFGSSTILYRNLEGKEGLHLAQKILKKFFKKYNCWPVFQIKPFKKIHGAALRKTWIQFGINSWKDLIHSVSKN